MRVYNILYYTDDPTKYQIFINDREDRLNTAANKATEVFLFESFKGTVPLFPNISYLSQFLENYERNLSDLTIIIDSECIIESNNSKLLRALMIEYPEVKFLFDGEKSPKDVIFRGEAMRFEQLSLEDCENCQVVLNSCIGNKSSTIKEKFRESSRILKEDTLNLLQQTVFYRENAKDADLLKSIRDVKQELSRTCAKKYVIDSLLKLPPKDSNLFINIVHTRDNLFDASNVRYALKQWEYAHLRVNKKNFDILQTSRRDNLAIIVEEEHGQNRYNSYCVFANGFRVLPITSATELRTVSTDSDIKKPSLIIRDYDLQFFDQGERGSEIINEIRGFKYNDNNTWSVHLASSPFWKQYYSNTNKPDQAMHLVSLTSNDNGNNIEDSSNSIDISEPAQIESANRTITPIYFVSKGTDKIELVFPGRFVTKDQESGKLLKRVACRFRKESDELRLLLPGIQKPVNGIYQSFQVIPEVKKRYENICCYGTEEIDTTREGHDHGTALDVHAIVQSLMYRSKKYYKRGKYVHAAVLANEAIEYLNGFHESILLQAYHILAISENALAMSIIGGDEFALRKDTLFRISKIAKEIERILHRDKGDSNYESRLEYKNNILIQIYSDCRKFCKEKEHFSSEDCFISSLAHVNEGFTLSKMSYEIKLFLKRIRNSWEAKKNDLNISNYD